MTDATAAPTSPAITRGQRALGVVTLLALTAIAFRNALPGIFVLDDVSNVLENPSIRRLSSLTEVFWPPATAGVGGRPFANFTLALNYAVSGTSPWSYHALNLVLHAVAALILAGIVRRTLQSSPGLREHYGRHSFALGLAVAAIWATHPLQTAVVDYVSQRTEELMALCYLITLYAFIRGATAATSARAWYCLALASCAAGMASKEVMVTAPLLLLLYDRTFLGGSFRTAWQARGRWHLGFTSLWLLLATMMAASHLAERGVGFGSVSPLTYALTEAHAILLYFKLAVWPHPLVFDYGWCFRPLGAASLGESLLVAFIALATIWACIRQPAIGFGLAWFLIILAPTSSVVPVVHQPIAESRVYLPLAGILAATVVGLYRATGRAVLTPLMLGIGAAAMLTLGRNTAFRDPLTLWRDTVAKLPSNARAHNNLAGTLLNAGRAPEAFAPAQEAVRLRPEYPDAHVNLGAALAAAGRIEEALGQHRIAAQLDPNHAGAQGNVGNALMLLGRPAEARAPLEAALRLNPNLAQAHNDLGVLLLDLGDFAGALAHDEAAIRLAPQMADAHYNRGNALARLERLPEALAEFDETLRLKPDFAKAHNNRGVVLLLLRRPAEAAASFEAALRYDPAHREAPRNLASARRAMADANRRSSP